MDLLSALVMLRHMCACNALRVLGTLCHMYACHVLTEKEVECPTRICELLTVILPLCEMYTDHVSTVLVTSCLVYIYHVLIVFPYILELLVYQYQEWVFHLFLKCFTTICANRLFKYAQAIKTTFQRKSNTILYTFFLLAFQNFDVVNSDISKLISSENMFSLIFISNPCKGITSLTGYKTENV